MNKNLSEACLVTGGGGQIGHALRLCLPKEARGLVRSHEQLDVSKPDKVYAMAQLFPTGVFHCAAYTNVRAAEENQDACWRTNAIGTHNVARLCARAGIPLIVFSTDYVFGGDQSRTLSYEEDDTVWPTTYYGQTKVAAEQAVLMHAQAYPSWWWAICRVAGVCELPWRPGTSVLHRIASSLQTRGKASVVDDVTTSFTTAEFAAAAAYWMLQNRKRVPSGIYHLASQPADTWYAIANRLQRWTEGTVSAVKSTQFERLSSRPVNRASFTALSVSKYLRLCDDGAPAPPPLSAAIDAWGRRWRRENGVTSTSYEERQML